MRRIPAACLTILCLIMRPADAADLRGDAAFAAGHYAAAFDDWFVAAQAGDASAMAAIGTLYDTGHGVPQNFANALAWYRRAAEAGNVRSMFNVGAMYDNGRGTVRNRNEAIRWYKMAADKGNGRAAYNLGVIYRDADGVARDRSAAIHYFRIASLAGIRAANPNLVALGAPRPQQPVPARPAPGGETENDLLARFQSAALARTNVDAVAAKAFAAAIPALLNGASEGNHLAEYDLGFAYELGIGQPVDLVKAYVYYLRAAGSEASQVTTAALQGATEVGARLSGAQHQAARDMLLSDLP